MSEDKKIEIVSGDENDLEISPVHDHISPIKPKNTDDKKPKNIVIPKEKKTDSKTDETEDNDGNVDNENNQ